MTLTDQRFYFFKEKSVYLFLKKLNLVHLANPAVTGTAQALGDCGSGSSQPSTPGARPSGCALVGPAGGCPDHNSASLCLKIPAFLQPPPPPRGVLGTQGAGLTPEKGRGPGRLLQSCRIMYLGLAGQWLRLPNPSPLIKSCDFPTLPPGPSLQPPGGLPTAPAAELVVIISVLYTLQLQTSVPSNISS